jgi:hypothetical protein
MPILAAWETPLNQILSPVAKIISVIILTVTA